MSHSTGTKLKETRGALPPGAPGKYLTFGLDQEVYAFEILKVLEIVGMVPITRLPGTPDFVRGVINLRGRILPVLSLRQKFGFPLRKDTERTCIIVLEVRRESRKVVMGIVVDEVHDVALIRADQVEPAPNFGNGVETRYLLGVAKVASRVIIVLDADLLLPRNELDQIDAEASKEAGP